MPALAETLRIATYNVELSRKGPGLLLRDILSGKDAQVEAAADVIAQAAPDTLLLTGFDYDLDLVALGAFARRIEERGVSYPHLFAFRPNRGLPTGLDIDDDGRMGEPDDAQGWGRFAGADAMAVLSRLPIDESRAADYSDFLWHDLPNALIGGAQLGVNAQAVQRLSTTGHWAVPIAAPDGNQITLLAWHATPPVFDGPEDRNGRRNHDETAFWLRLLEGALPYPAPVEPFVILGDANLDPVDGDGRPAAISALLSDGRVQDPAPASAGGNAASAEQGGSNGGQKGDPSLDTADWPDDGGPGNLRVDYVLPSAGLNVTDAGVWWPEPGSEGAEEAAAASRHRLVWVEIELR